MPVPFTLTCPAPLAARGFALRIACPGDEVALRQIYHAQRWPEFAPLGLPEAQIIALIDTQYAIQQQHYRANYDNPRFFVLEHGEQIGGRLLLGEAAGALRILDILMTPALRGQGVGGTLLAGLRDQAGAAGWAVALHVAKDNPAQRLYHRLGFRVDGDIGIGWAMSWSASAGLAAGDR